MKVLYIFLVLIIITCAHGLRPEPKENHQKRTIEIDKKCLIIISKLLDVAGTKRTQLCCNQEFVENAREILTNINDNKNSIDILKEHQDALTVGKSNCAYKSRWTYNKDVVIKNGHL